MEEKVILVDTDDNQIGLEDKLEAHKQGKLHRAISVFVFNSKKELLLQKRADAKYHCEGLWANTCCSHPRPGESAESAAHRRLQEEMGFDCGLKEIFSFRYFVKFDNGLAEHEYDHVFVGKYRRAPAPDAGEVADFKWMRLDKLEKDAQANPEKYTYWLLKTLPKIRSYLQG